VAHKADSQVIAASLRLTHCSGGTNLSLSTDGRRGRVGGAWQGKASALKELQARRAQKEKAAKKKKRQRAEEDGVEMSEDEASEEEEEEEEEEARGSDSEEEAAQGDADDEKEDPVMTIEMLQKVRLHACWSLLHCYRTLAKGGTI
jgi:hypothetical protein